MGHRRFPSCSPSFVPCLWTRVPKVALAVPWIAPNVQIRIHRVDRIQLRDGGVDVVRACCAFENGNEAMKTCEPVCERVAIAEHKPVDAFFGAPGDAPCGQRTGLNRLMRPLMPPCAGRCSRSLRNEHGDDVAK